MADWKLSIDRAHFSTRLRSLFFPLGMEDLEPGLQLLGFKLLPGLEQGALPAIPAGLGLRLSPSGRVARNEETGCAFNMNAERGILSMQATSAEVAVGSFEKLQSWIEQEAGVNITAEARFFEFILDATLQIGVERKPYDVAKNAFADSQLMARLSEKTGITVGSFGVHLVDRRFAPGDDEWFDLKIEPAVARPDVALAAAMVYRSKDREPVAARARDAEQLIKTVFEQMEVQSQ